MRLHIFIPFAILSVALLSAQNDAKPTEPKKPPTPKERAREIVDKAIETLAGTQPQVQVAGLLHLAELYTDFDKKRSDDIFRQAFAAAAALPQESRRNDRSYMMSQVASVVAEHNLDLALELLPQMGPPQSGERDYRVAAVDQIVRQLISRKRTDRAIEFLILMGSEGEFAYNAADSVMDALPDGDGRKSHVFSAATTAYATRPVGPFVTFVSGNWQQVPQPLAEAAITAILNAQEANRKKDNKESYTQTVSNSKGSVSFTSQENAELFNVLHVIRAINPKKADEILESRPELREAIAQFPRGRESMVEEDKNISQNTSQGGAQRDPQREAEMRLRAYSNARMQEAMLQLKQPEKALALIRQIPIEEMKATALSRVANQIADKDPSTAKSVLTQCLNLLDNMKKPRETVDAYVEVAEAAHKVHDEERAKLALDRALTGATELYKKDVNADAPNLAPREYWPSTQSYRRIVYRATSMYGADAEYVLPKISDPDLQLLASIEMARSLLKKPSRSSSMMTDSTSRR